MEAKDFKDIAIVAVVAYGLSVALELFGKEDTKNTPIPAGFSPNPNATITWQQGIQIADIIKANVKNPFTEGKHNLINIDQAMWKLQNPFDVEVVWNAFGQYDGPFFFNGDMIGVLNKIIESNYYIGSDANLKSIRDHLYTYSQYFIYK